MEMDNELMKRLNEKKYLQTFQYLKEMYCDDAECEHCVFSNVVDSLAILYRSQRSPRLFTV